MYLFRECLKSYAISTRARMGQKSCIFKNYCTANCNCLLDFKVIQGMQLAVMHYLPSSKFSVSSVLDSRSDFKLLAVSGIISNTSPL